MQQMWSKRFEHHISSVFDNTYSTTAIKARIHFANKRPKPLQQIRGSKPKNEVQVQALNTIYSDHKVRQRDRSVWKLENSNQRRPDRPTAHYNINYSNAVPCY